MRWRLDQLAERIGAQLLGDPSAEVDSVGDLKTARAGQLSFLSDTRYRWSLKTTKATAVLLKAEDQPVCATNSLVCEDPYLGYAKAATLIYPAPPIAGGIAASAVVDDSAEIAPSATIGPGCYVGSGAKILANAVLGPNSVILDGAKIGPASELVANVTVCDRSVIGARCLLHPGSVIGADGFGLAYDNGRWQKIPQVGRVILGDDVEIGANTTIDRGAIGDTVIEDGVKLDNLIMVGHNTRIGAHTAAAGCVGIAGSADIGKGCTLAGGVGVAGHTRIADGVHIAAASSVMGDIREPGNYAGTVPTLSRREWRRNYVRLRQLDALVKRVEALEAELTLCKPGKSVDPNGD